MKLKLEKNQTAYFISDTHAYHKNICKGSTKWDLNDHGGSLSVRDFKDEFEMTDVLVDSINETVLEDDFIIHLGDFSFGGIENIWNFRKRINCKNIILILGNHDHHILNNRELPNCYTEYSSKTFESQKDVKRGVFEKVRAQEIFHSVHSALSLQIGKNTFELCHYPYAVWNKAHHGRIHLHGHCHGSYQTDGRLLDVGVDNLQRLNGNMKPLNIDYIMKYMVNKEYHKKTHHNQNTN